MRKIFTTEDTEGHGEYFVLKNLEDIEGSVFSVTSVVSHLLQFAGGLDIAICSRHF